MKKILFGVFAGLILVTIVTISGCKKDDTTPPVISVGADFTISLNASSASEPAYSANDDEDGSVSVTSDWSWGTNPNPNLAGTYEIHYTATDAAGNQGSAHMTVTVRNDAYFLVGTYSCTEPPSTTPWTQTITADASVNNKIHFSKFANYSNNTGITAMVSGAGVGATVDLSTSQNGVNIGTSGCTHTFTPQSGGATVTGSPGSYTFSIKFTDMQLAGGSGCPATSAVPYEDVFVQQ